MSTMMRVILGLDAPDEGTALIGGQPYRTLWHPLSRVGVPLDAAALGARFVLLPEGHDSLAVGRRELGRGLGDAASGVPATAQCR
jgi:hypothetical protein